MQQITYEREKLLAEIRFHVAQMKAAEAFFRSVRERAAIDRLKSLNKKEPR